MGKLTKAKKHLKSKTKKLSSKNSSKPSVIKKSALLPDTPKISKNNMENSPSSSNHSTLSETTFRLNWGPMKVHHFV